MNLLAEADLFELEVRRKRTARTAVVCAVADFLEMKLAGSPFLIGNATPASG